MDPIGAGTRRWWVALVTFERSKKRTQSILPADCQGACGWMACLATAEEEVGDRIEIALGAVGLKTVEIQDVTSVQGPEEADEFDDHLAQNMENLEQTKTVVWGTIHLYRADSDA